MRRDCSVASQIHISLALAREETIRPDVGKAREVVASEAISAAPWKGVANPVASSRALRHGSKVTGI